MNQPIQILFLHQPHLHLHHSYNFILDLTNLALMCHLLVDDPLHGVRVPIFGDQLTRVRLAGAKDLCVGCHPAQQRFDHLYPICIVDWHTKRSYLKVNSVTMPANDKDYNAQNYIVGIKKQTKIEQCFSYNFMFILLLNCSV